MTTPLGPTTTVEPSESVTVKALPLIVYVVPSITISVTEIVVGSVVVPFCDMLDDIVVGSVVVPFCELLDDIVVGSVVVPFCELLVDIVVGSVVVPFCEMLDDIMDVIVTCVIRVIVVGSSAGLNGGQFVGMSMTSPGKMRLGSAICGFPSSRQARSTLYAIAKLYNVSPSTTMCCPPGDNGRLITSPGYIKSKSEICGFSASRRPSGMPCA